MQKFYNKLSIIHEETAVVMFRMKFPIEKLPLCISSTQYFLDKVAFSSLIFLYREKCKQSTQQIGLDKSLF